MAGRPRKPTALHQLEGTGRKHRLNPREPRWPVGRPTKPAHVAARPDASREWTRIVPVLLEQRVLSPAYRASLEAYCGAYADVVEGERLKGQPGFAPFVLEVTVDSNPQEHERLKPHPVIKMVNDARKELRQWAVQLGITAASAAKVSVAAPPTPERTELEFVLGRTGRRAR